MDEETEFYFSFQSISCYGLLSPDPIRSPQLTGWHLILPFFQGCRYAAIPLPGLMVLFKLTSTNQDQNLWFTMTIAYT